MAGTAVYTNTQEALWAFVTDISGRQGQVVPPPISGEYAEAHAVNAAGDIAGDVQSGFPPQAVLGHAMIGGPGGMVDAGALSGNAIAWGISPAGTIAGSTQVPGSVNQHAFARVGTTMYDLGTLGGTYSYAWAINGKDQVAGEAQGPAPDYAIHAAVWDLRNRKLHDLGNLSISTSARAINAKGAVVGTIGRPNMNSAMVGGLGVPLADLNNLVVGYTGAWLTGAYGINAKGQIVADSYDGHCYLLSPD